MWHYIYVANCSTKSIKDAEWIFAEQLWKIGSQYMKVLESFQKNYPGILNVASPKKIRKTRAKKAVA